MKVLNFMILSLVIYFNTQATSTITRLSYLENNKEVDCTVSICLDEYNYCPVFYAGAPSYYRDTLLNTKGYIEVDLFSCKGAMRLKEFDSDGNLVAEGEYIESLDTLKSYVVVSSFGDNGLGEERNYIKVSSYFQPLRDGVWKIRDKDNNFKIVEYDRGLRVN